MGILRHRLRHGQRALDQLAQGRLRAVGRGHHGLAPADEDAQAQILALGPFEPLGPAQALGVGEGRALDQHRVGLIGPGASGPGDQVGEQVEGLAVGGHGCRRSRLPRWNPTTGGSLPIEARGPAGNRSGAPTVDNRTPDGEVGPSAGWYLGHGPAHACTAPLKGRVHEMNIGVKKSSWQKGLKSTASQTRA